jgi:hypothetical protein
MDPPATEDIEGAIGRAVTFTSGTLAGQTIRTKLVVLQDGGFTRKCVCTMASTMRDRLY